MIEFICLDSGDQFFIRLKNQIELITPVVNGIVLKLISNTSEEINYSNDYDYRKHKGNTLIT